MIYRPTGIARNGFSSPFWKPAGRQNQRQGDEHLRADNLAQQQGTQPHTENRYQVERQGKRRVADLFDQHKPQNLAGTRGQNAEIE